MSLKAKISRETVRGACELELEVDDEGETLEEVLEKLELDELLETLLVLEVEEVDLLEEVLLLDLEELVTLDVMELSEETLLDELFPLELVKLQAVAHIAMSIKAPNNKLFFFIKNPLQLLNNKITIFFNG